MRVLRARGDRVRGARCRSPACAELLRPALGRARPRSRRRRRRARGRARAAARPSAQDRFAVGAATLSLLAAYAEEAPVALLVDDAHLLDGSSAEALLFAARRLLADPIAVVLAVREGEPSLLDGADLPRSALGGLDRDDAAALLRRRTSPPTSVDRLLRARPAATRWRCSSSPRTRAASRTARRGRRCRSRRASRTAFLRRVGELPEATRRALLLAAPSDACGPRRARARRRAARRRLTALDAAEEAWPRVTSAPARRVQPPARALGVYADATAAERREAHAALAAALPDRDVDRRAWHLAAAASARTRKQPTRSSRPAREPRAQRVRLGRRSVRASRAALARRRGTTEGSRCRRRDGLARGGLRADVALLEGSECTGGDHLRGQVAMRRGPVQDGFRLMVAAAEQSDDRDDAVSMSRTRSMPASTRAIRRR